MQAIILAAGRGNRLRPLTDKIPKSLVEVKGKSFIVNKLEALSKHKEIDEVIIVVGYKKEMIMDKIGEKYRELKITYIENDEWESTNNVYSLWMAMDHISDDFILMEGDIFFEHDILESIFENRSRNIALLSKFDYGMSGTVVKLDERGSKKASKMLVEMNELEHKIRRLIPSSEQDIDFDYTDKYKTVNIYYFTHEFFEDYFKPRLDLFVKTHGSGSYYELILGVLVYLNTPNIYGHVIDRAKWNEVDTENDLSMAEYNFSSKLERIDILDKLNGGFWRFDFLDFMNVYNQYFPSESLISKLTHEIPYLISNYSSSKHKLQELLSQWYFHEGFVKENIFVGNGTSELLSIINQEMVKKITIPVPSYFNCNNLDTTQINEFSKSEIDDFNVNVDQLISSIKESCSNFLQISNPNNLTSSVIKQDDLIYLLDHLKDLEGVIIDESYIDFTIDVDKFSLRKYITKYPNLIILCDLSKTFGVPGLRIGYLVTANQKVKDILNCHMPERNINAIAEKFIDMFPRYQREYEQSIKMIVKDRDVFINNLEAIDMFKIYNCHSNFLFCKIKDKNMDSVDLRLKLFSDHDILIDVCNFLNSKDRRFVRISVRNTEFNHQFVNACKEIKSLYNKK